MKKGDLAELRKRSIFQWMWRAVCNWLEIVAILCVAGYVDHWVVYGLASLLLATRQHALALLAHDGAHYALSRNKAVNDWLTCLFSMWPVGMGMDGYREFHYKHHRFVGTAKDPELIHKEWAKEEWSLPLSRPRLAWLIVKDVFGHGIIDIIRVMKIVRPISLKDKIGPPITMGLLSGICILFGWYFIPLMWFGALFTSQWAVFRLRMLTEHVGTAETHRISIPFWMRILQPHNTWCHFEHHMEPAIPSWNLPQARQHFDAPRIIPVQELFSSHTTSEEMPIGIPVG
jgi:fatty acid desaturase